MSEQKYKLKVPDELPEGFPEYISQGNHAVTVEAGAEVEVDSMEFASWLCRTHGFEDMTPPDDGEYAEDFPRRDVFIGLGLAIAEVRVMDRDELIALNGVGEKTADAVLEYFPRRVTNHVRNTYQ